MTDTTPGREAVWRVISLQGMGNYTAQADALLTSSDPEVHTALAASLPTEVLKREFARRTGADPTPRPANTQATPGQLWAELLDMEEGRRLQVLEHFLHAQASAAVCFIQNHAARLERLEATR